MYYSVVWFHYQQDECHSFRIFVDILLICISLVMMKWMTEVDQCSQTFNVSGLTVLPLSNIFWKVFIIIKLNDNFRVIKAQQSFSTYYLATNVPTNNKHYGIASFGQTVRFTAENRPIKLSYFIEPYKSRSEVSSGLAPPANFQIYCGLISITFDYLCSWLWKGRAPKTFSSAEVGEFITALL